MAIVLNGSGTVTGVTNVGSAAANTPVVLQDSGSNTNTCRAWVNFNGTDTVAIRASFNVSSITDNSTGNYTVNFTNAMPDANYVVVGMTDRGSTSAPASGNMAVYNNTYSASSVTVSTGVAGGSTSDFVNDFVAVFR